MPARRRRAEELEGYLEGVRARLALLPPSGPGTPGLRSQWERAREALRRGRSEEADRGLRSIDEALDRLRSETTVFQRPRGLTGYTPIGDREVPPGPEEEPLENRLRVLTRLSGVRASEGRDVGPVLRALASARAALDRGDPAVARQYLDTALDALSGPVP